MEEIWSKDFWSKEQGLLDCGTFETKDFWTKDKGLKTAPRLGILFEPGLSRFIRLTGF